MLSLSSGSTPPAPSNKRPHVAGTARSSHHQVCWCRRRPGKTAAERSAQRRVLGHLFGDVGLFQRLFSRWCCNSLWLGRLICFSGSVLSARTSSARVASGAGGRGAGAWLASSCCGTGRCCDRCCCLIAVAAGVPGSPGLCRRLVTAYRNRLNAGSTACLRTGVFRPASQRRPPSLRAVAGGRRPHQQRTSPRSKAPDGR